ncbi:hypothetical protein ABT224_11290 [Streptomyces sp. NPDC001584]|uniref:hypothetical protein n=1 Tax=Streptomyces sp. NPDC001584 TaxID=3154521 RepID=UPI00331C28D5
MAQPPSATISALIRKVGNVKNRDYVDFLRDLLSLDETVRTQASNCVQDFVNLLSVTQARVVGDLIAMLAPREESRVALEALLHALSDLDGCGKLEGVDLSPLGEIPESMIHVEHRVYMDAFAEDIARDE